MSKVEATAYQAAMLRALELANQSPRYGQNPQVGAVLINDQGEILAEGLHRGAGTAHAEIDALNNLAAKNLSAKGLTAVVTLEPCNHTGITGPCAKALIEAGIKKVIFGAADPGEAEGGGRITLKQAGVEVLDGLYEKECRVIIAPWFVNKFEKRPYVIIKWAASLDGRTAAADTSSKWITGAESRNDVHARRSESQAILVGTNTVELDDPELTARKPNGDLYPDQPLRVIVGQRKISKDKRIFDEAAETIQLETHDLSEAMATLFERGINQVFVEGGSKIESELIKAGFADEFLIYLAPKLLGGPAVAIGDIGVSSIDKALDLEIIETLKLGNDILVRAVKKES